MGALGNKNAPVKFDQLAHWQVELLPSAPYNANYTTIQPVIGFSFDMQCGTHAFASDKRETFHAMPNGLAYVPEDCNVYSESDKGGEYLRIVCVNTENKRCTAGRPFSNVVNGSAINAAYRLRRALLAKGTADILDCEQSLTVLEECVANVLEKSDLTELKSTWMTARRIKRIEEYIEEHLESKLTVTQISNAFGLSSAHFSREFKKAIGQTPHQYIIDKRLARARVLLQQSHQNIGAIAFDCGFSSHSHMAEQFRLRLGISPEHWRNGRFR